MAKYLTEFNTYAEYQAATLSLPNVSLIKSTGKVYYKNVFAGASLGDILMWDNVNNKLVTTIGGNWSAEAFPIAQYEPIAINVYPAAQASDGKSRYMALRWASNESDTGSTTYVSLVWGNNSTTAGDITSTDQTALNGKENTDKALALADGTTANTQAAFAAFAAVNRFRTNGTSASDWYVPSYAELSLYASNYADINAKITAIKNASSSIVDTVNYDQWSSTEDSEYFSCYLNGYDGSLGTNYRASGCCVRGMIAL
jgi:hypothetical protein